MSLLPAPDAQAAPVYPRVPAFQAQFTLFRCDLCNDGRLVAVDLPDPGNALALKSLLGPEGFVLIRHDLRVAFRPGRV